MKCIIKLLQTDKRNKNILSLSRDASISLLMKSHHNKNGNTNAMEKKPTEPYYIKASFLLYFVLKGVIKNMEEEEGKSLNGTEGIWDVSVIFSHSKYL